LRRVMGEQSGLDQITRWDDAQGSAICRCHVGPPFVSPPVKVRRVLSLNGQPCQVTIAYEGGLFPRLGSGGEGPPQKSDKDSAWHDPFFFLPSSPPKVGQKEDNSAWHEPGPARLRLWWSRRRVNHCPRRFAPAGTIDPVVL
jgi:hypothetical protein